MFGELYKLAVKEKVQFFGEQITREDKKREVVKSEVEANQLITQEKKERARKDREAHEAERAKLLRDKEERKAANLKLVELASKGQLGSGGTMAPALNDPSDDQKQVLAEKARLLAEKQRQQAEAEKAKKAAFSNKNKMFDQPEEKPIPKMRIEIESNISAAKTKFQ